MPNLLNVSRIFNEYLSTNWAVTPIYWDNMPNDLQEKREWIRPSLVIDFSENATINDGRIRHSGQYIIRIFIPLSIGIGKGYDLGSQLIKLLQNKTLDENLLTYAGSIKEIGDGGYGWYQFNVFIPFDADQQLTD